MVGEANGTLSSALGGKLRDLGVLPLGLGSFRPSPAVRYPGEGMGLEVTAEVPGFVLRDLSLHGRKTSWDADHCADHILGAVSTVIPRH
jgi:hypothetical protein